jgi:diguanylate cyclase (GGDEF)-like protein
VRNELGNKRTRLILRTGQPGYAPEADVVRRYDINDYHEKTELNFRRLTTSLIAALRAYEQIEALERHRDGLELLVNGLVEMFGRRAIHPLADGVLRQFATLLHVPVDGLVCAGESGGDSELVIVLAGAGDHAGRALHPLADVPQPDVRRLVRRAFAERQTIIEPHAVVLHAATPSGRDIAIYVAIDQHAPPLVDLNILRVFGHNLALAFENADLVERAERLAYVDGATGLPNEARYADLMAQDLLTGRRDWTLLLDLVRFRVISDAYGVEIGNGVLSAFGNLLCETLPEARFIGRRHKDEFIVVLDGAADPLATTQKLRQVLATPIKGAPIETPLQMRAGIVRASDLSTPSSMLAEAGVALFESKRVYTDQTFFEARLLDGMRERLDITAKLREALQLNALTIHFQPLLNTADRQPLGAEALLRAPAELVPASTPQIIATAEQSGLIVELGLWVFHAALLWQSSQRAQGHHLTININVSPTQLRHPVFQAEISRLLDMFGADARLITIEVTEEVFIDPGSPATQALTWFRSLGGKVAIDDFGTGYSSLGYLSRMPVDIVKIDRSFVTSVERSQRDRDVLESMVRIAKAHVLEITAEGVETEGQYQILRDLGVDKIQGYLVGRPMPEAQFATWLAEAQAKSNL